MSDVTSALGMDDDDDGGPTLSNVTGVDIDLTGDPVGDIGRTLDWDAERAFSADNLFGSLTPSSGDDIQAPTPTTAEERLNQMIMDQLGQQNAMSDLLMPFMMAEMGYKYSSTPGEDGKPVYSITRMTEDEIYEGLSAEERYQKRVNQSYLRNSLVAQGTNPDTLEGFKTEEESWGFMTPQQLLTNGVDPTTKTRLTEEQRYARLDEIGKAQYDVQKESLGMQLKGLRGELPISPGLERDIAKGTELAGADLSQRLGPQWEQSTAGIQTMGKLNEGANIARDAARRGWLSDTAGIASGVGSDIRANKAFNQNVSASMSPNLGLLGNLYTQGAGTVMGQQGQKFAGLTGAPGYGNDWQGYQTAMQPYQYYAGLANQANMQNSANAAQERAGLYNMYGTVAGAGLTAAALRSSKDFKKDIKKNSGADDEDVLDMVKNNETFSYRYKGESGASPKRVGLITEHSPMGMGLTGDMKHLDIGKTIGVLTTATKALAKKVDKLERRS